MNRLLVAGAIVATTLALGGCDKAPATSSTTSSSTTTTTPDSAAPATTATPATPAPAEPAATSDSGQNQNSNVPPGVTADKPSN
jgi:hypothetical protein